MTYRFPAILAVFCTILSVSPTSTMMRRNGDNQWTCPSRITSIHFIDDQQLYIQGKAVQYMIDTINRKDFGQISKTYRKKTAGLAECALFCATNSLQDKVNGTFKKRDLSLDQTFMMILSDHQIKIIGKTEEMIFSKKADFGMIPEEWFCDVAMSEDNSKLAIATTKNNIYVLDVSEFTNTANHSRLVTPRSSSSQSTHHRTSTPRSFLSSERPSRSHPSQHLSQQLAGQRIIGASSSTYSASSSTSYQCDTTKTKELESTPKAKHVLHGTQNINEIFFTCNGLLHITDTEKNHYLYDVNIHRCNPTSNAEFFAFRPNILKSIDHHKPLQVGQTIFDNTVYLIEERYNIRKRITHNATIEHAFFSNNKALLIAQSAKKITICPVGQQLICTLNYTDFDNTKFKHIALNSDDSTLAICTKANNIYYVDLTQCRFVEHTTRSNRQEEVTTPRQMPTITNNTSNDSTTHKASWWDRLCNTVTNNKWKIACTTAAVIAGSYALYKWKTNKQVFNLKWWKK